MSTAVKQKLNTTEITERASKALGLEDTKRLGIALTAAAVEELARSPIFASRVRAIYASLPSSPVPRKKETTAKALTVDVTPIKHVDGFSLNPAMPLDPYLIYEAYGAKQFATVLDLFTVPKLKEAAKRVEERNPGTKPTNRGTKVPLIDYLVKYIPSGQ